MKPMRFGLVGTGWRAEFFLRVARALPAHFTLAGAVVRDAAKGEAFTARWGAPTFRTASDMLAQTGLASDGFAITSVPQPANPVVVRELVAAGCPVLSETPPAPTVDELVTLWTFVHEQGGRVQVAEQYHLQPMHAAREAIVRSGRLGEVSQVQVSVAHTYHGLSLMRRLLGVGFEAPRVRAMGFSSPVIAGPGRSGPPSEERVQNAWQELFLFEFDGKFGLYDFNYEQYFNWIRNERLLIRGDRGEIINDQVAWLADVQTPIRQTLTRHGGGEGGNLEGLHLRGVQCGEGWVYRNPFAPASLPDDELAVAACMAGMARFVETGEPFYSLAEGLQDQYLGLIAGQAIKSGQVVQAEVQPWANG